MRFFAAAACLLLLAIAAPANAQPADRFITDGGLRLHYLDWGNAGAPPLVLLHGIDRIAHTFDHIAPRFTSRYHVIAMDLRGHGDSGWDPEGRYLVEDHVGDLERLVKTLGLRNVTLWGNSTGGRVVQVFAGLHPDLVAAVIAEDVGPERPRSIADAYARRVKQEEDGWAGPDELLAQMRAAPQPLPDAVLEPYVRYGTKRRDDGRLVWKRDPNLVKGFVETELWRYVRNIKAPILYVLGGRSTIVPQATQDELKKVLPQVRIVTMPGLGHYPSDEKPEAFANVVDEFLGPRVATGRLVLSTTEELFADVQRVPCGVPERLAAAVALFERAGGVSAESVEVVRLGRVQNVVVRVAGESPETVVIGAHYDRAETGCGAVDNWTGVVAVAHLFKTLKAMPLRKSLVFVAFGDEEKGLLGSRAMVKQIPKAERRRHCAMVNLDSFSRSKPQILDNASSKKLAQLGAELANVMQMPFGHAAVRSADSDSTAFANSGIPAVTIHGLGPDYASILHTRNDQLDKVNPDSLYLGYRLALAIVSRVDSADCAAFR